MTPSKLRKQLMTASRCASWVFDEVIDKIELETLLEDERGFEGNRDELIRTGQVYIEQITRLIHTLERLESYEQMMKGDIK